MAEQTVTLPDGSGFAVASLAMPRDHWLTREGFNVPPMPWRTGDGTARGQLAEEIRVAARYAIRAATMNGKESDFDPDAMVQNFVVGMLGYWTEDGYSFDARANPPASESSGVPARGEWRCFHCDDVFTNERWAREHFGIDQSATPACKIRGADGSLLGVIRAQEDELRRLRAELSEENSRLVHAMMAIQSERDRAVRDAEEEGYGRGVRGMKAIAEKQFGAEVIL